MKIIIDLWNYKKFLQFEIVFKVFKVNPEDAKFIDSWKISILSEMFVFLLKDQLSSCTFLKIIILRHLAKILVLNTMLTHDLGQRLLCDIKWDNITKLLERATQNFKVQKREKICWYWNFLLRQTMNFPIVVLKQLKDRYYFFFSAKFFWTGFTYFKINKTHIL